MQDDREDTPPRPAQPHVTRRHLLAGGVAAGALVATFALNRRYGAAAPVPPGSDEAASADRASVDEPAEPPAADAPPEGGEQPGPLVGSTEPRFSDVARADPETVLRFLAGRHPRYPEADLDSIMRFSAANILETMDTDVLDTVLARRGGAALATLYEVIARQLLEALLAVYGEAPVVLALDAGHGGKPGVFHDAGSGGTEAVYTRGVVEAVEAQVDAPRYAGITLRRIYNDEIGDDFGLPAPEDRKGAAALTMRLARAAMLAHEAAARNRVRPETSVAVHLVSVHFNAGSGGMLVLHQSNDVAAAFRQRSVTYARAFLAGARPTLNGSGLLPYALGLALGNGLSDDVLLYEPPLRRVVNPYTGVNRNDLPRRYAMLLDSLFQRDYADGALRYHGLS